MSRLPEEANALVSDVCWQSRLVIELTVHKAE